MPAKGHVLIPRPDLAPGEGFCTRCRLVKPLTSFYRNKNTPTGYAYWCSSCLSWNQDRYERRWYRRRRDSQALVARRAYGGDLSKPVKGRAQTYREAVALRAAATAAKRQRAA